MRGLGLTVSLVALMAVAPPALATSKPKNVNVCSLASASQATAIAGVSSKCTNTGASPGVGSTLYTGNWAGKSKSVSLMVTVSVYTDTGALALAKQNLNQGLPGTPSKLRGIGTAAYKATSADTAAIHLSVGSDIVIVSLTTTGSTPKVSPPLIAFAGAIARKL